MSDTPALHGVPPLLVAIATYIADRPQIDQLERALHAARHILLMPGDSFPREGARQRFIQDEGEDRPELAHADSELMTAAQVSFGDPAFLFGLACGWLLLHDGLAGQR